MTQKVKKYTEKTVIMESHVTKIKAIVEMAMMTRITIKMEKTFLCLRLND